MKPPRNPVDDAARAAFDSYLLAWQERLGLQDWRVKRATKSATNDNMAQVKIFQKSRMANAYLGNDFGGLAVNDESLEATVVHELLHVLLAELVNQVEWGITDVVLESAEHRVIHVLEKLILRPHA